MEDRGHADTLQASMPGSPVQLKVEYAERLSRWKLFLKWLFVVPLLILWVFYGLAAGLATFLAFWGILFTGRYPSSLFSFVKGYLAFTLRVIAYFPLLLVDQWAPDRTHPVALEIDEPADLSGFVLLFVKLPAYLLNVVFTLALCAFAFLIVTAIPIWWVILVTGKYPRPWFLFSVRLLEWIAGVIAWQHLMRDEFSLFGKTRPVQVAVGVGALASGVISLVFWLPVLLLMLLSAIVGEVWV